MDHNWGSNLICREEGTDTSYYLYNAHGDVVNLTNTTGAVTKAYDYSAFGIEQNQDTTDTNPFRYCGEYYDAETGTYYLRVRYYNPLLGRFSQPDAWGGDRRDPLTLNKYIYCYNAPTMYLDPSGLKSIPLRSTIESLGGSIIWVEDSKTAIVQLDGKSVRIYSGDSSGSYIKGNKMYTDDEKLFAALGSTFDLGGGWTGRMERGTSGKDYQKHVHIYKGDRHWAQNEDGSPHDDGKNSPGSPPKTVLRRLNRKKNWDWTEKEKNWMSKIEISCIDGSCYVITYPNGRTVHVEVEVGYIGFFLTEEHLRLYAHGETNISVKNPLPNTPIFFLPLPSGWLLPEILPSVFPIPAFA